MVSARTRARVEAAADALGYRPNLIARSLIKRRSDIVGLAVGYMENQFYPDLVMALSRKLADVHKRSLIFPIAGATASDPEVEEILHYQLDALILTSATLSSRLASRCRVMGVPVVLINRVTSDSACDSVTGDNEVGGSAIGDFVVAVGYERPAFIAGIEDSSTSREREAGFCNALKRGGRDLFAREAGLYRFEAAAAAMRRLLSRDVRPDVVFAANDHMAIAAHNVASHEFGLTVGRDISLIGFDDVAMAGWPCFSLTTYSQPVDPMAEAAVALIGAERDSRREATHERIPGSLIVRGSARPKFAV